MNEINQRVLEILSTVDIIENQVKITEQIDRKLYLSVNEVLNRIGGKWNRKAKAHIFNIDPTELLETIINSGLLEPKIKTGYFPTPSNIVKTMIDLLELQPGDTILEPSAGQGHICDFLPKDNLIIGEILSENIQILKQKGYNITFTDFMKYESNRIDKIIMNPPFEKQQDIDHVQHAFKLLKPNGILVSIMSIGCTFRNNTKTKNFQNDILDKAKIIYLPNGSFKSSGTMVNTIIIKIKGINYK